VLILMPPKIGCEFSAQQPRVHRTANNCLRSASILLFLLMLEHLSSIHFVDVRKAFLTRKTIKLVVRRGEIRRKS
jgi:hypothetical protein